MPHINMIYPFRPMAEFAVLAEKFARVASKIVPLELELAQFRFFEHRWGNYTLWLAPEPEERLIHLQTKLLAVVPDCDDVNRFPGGFTPHLSVGQVQGRSKLRELQEKLQESWQSFSFVVSEISLIWRGEPPDDIFRRAYKVALKT